MDRKVIALAAALAATAAQAQPQPPRKADPADPAASVPPLRYESAFKGFRPSTEVPVAPWRKVNEEVAGSGMHGGHGGSKAAEGKAPEAKAADPRPADARGQKH